MIVPHTRAWATAQKTRTLTTANASVCRVCCSRPTETTSWQCRNNLALTARFQLVEKASNDFRLAVFLRYNHFLTQANGAKNQILSCLCTVLRTWAACLSWFYCTRTINSAQFIEILKVKTSLSCAFFVFLS